MDTSRQASIKKVTVSVCMVTYNRANLIGEAIASVQSQNYQDWEMIIVDDGSTDNTRSVVEGYDDDRIRYYRNDVNQDVSQARNFALSHARGDFVAVLDSDDIWIDPDKLEKQISFLKLKPDVMLVGTRAVSINQAGKKLGVLENPMEDKNIRKVILKTNPFIHSSVVFRTRPAIAIGGYDISLSTAEDYELFLRLGKMGRLANLPDYMVGYRIHEGNIIVSRRSNAMKSTLLIVKKFKKSYPNFYSAWLRRFVRCHLYKIFCRLGFYKT